jgi:hypothetical protein
MGIFDFLFSSKTEDEEQVEEVVDTIEAEHKAAQEQLEEDNNEVIEVLSNIEIDGVIIDDDENTYN